MLPFLTVPGMVYMASEYSQFWEEYPSIFLLGVGMMITHITGGFNLASSAGMRFDPFFLDPVLFLGVLYCDYNQALPRSQL